MRLSRRERELFDWGAWFVMNSCFGSVSGGCFPPPLLQPDHIIDLPLSLTGGAERTKWLVRLASLRDSHLFATSIETAGLEILEGRFQGSQLMGSIRKAWRWTSCSWFWQNAYLRFLGRRMSNLFVLLFCLDTKIKLQCGVRLVALEMAHASRLGLDALFRPASLGTFSQKRPWCFLSVKTLNILKNIQTASTGLCLHNRCMLTVLLTLKQAIDHCHPSVAMHLWSCSLSGRNHIGKVVPAEWHVTGDRSSTCCCYYCPGFGRF